MVLKEKIAYNTILQLIGKVLGLLIGFFSIALLTRYLGKNGYGQYTTIIAFLQLFGIIADLGIYNIVVQLINQPEIDEDKIVSNALTLRLFSLFFFLFIACLIGFFIPTYSLTIKIGICLTSLTIVFVSLNQILVASFQKRLNMFNVVLADFMGKFVNLVLIVLAVILKLNFFFILFALVFSSFLNFLLVLFSTKKFLKIRPAFDLNLWRIILKRSWPIGLSIIFSAFYFKIDTVLLSLFRSQSEVGIYGASYRLVEVLNSFPMLFIGLIAPLLNQSWAKNDLSYFKSVLQKSFDSLIIVVIPLVFGGYILAKKIMLLIAGNQFTQSGDVFRILIFAVAFLFLGQLFSQAMIALRQQKMMMKYYILTFIVGLVGYLILIPRYSYFGAAIMTVLTEFLITCLSGIFLLRMLKIKLKPDSFLKSLFSAGVMAFFLIMFPLKNFFILFFLGTIIYFLTLYLIGGYSAEFIKQLIRTK